MISKAHNIMFMKSFACLPLSPCIHARRPYVDNIEF